MRSEKLNPHVIGPGKEGHSENAHYKFIHEYRTKNIHDLDYTEYLKLHIYNPERNEEIEKLLKFERNSIQVEMLIYLKFWEADLIIKKLYQFTRAIHGEPYDWHFKIKESNRDSTVTGSRQEIIRLKIRDRLKEHSLPLHDHLKMCYNTQTRNSIAHSKYSFIGRNIHPNNYIKSDPSHQLRCLTFDQWVDMFNGTLVLYNEYIRLKGRVNDFYAAFKFVVNIPYLIHSAFSSPLLREIAKNHQLNQWLK